jgi:hemoglobin-like flavoprotein
MHTLTDTEKKRAQRAFAAAFSHADTLGLLFYARLFELDPMLRALFKTDLEEQAHSLMTMLKLCMEGLDERAELQYALRNLGARHLEYGVKPGDYATVENALLWTMRQALGNKWDAETEAALQAAFHLFVTEMQSADPK